MTAKGWNGSVSFDGQMVTIRRDTLVGRFTMGRSEKRVPVASLTAVQLRRANVVVNGFIQFSFPGAEERNDTRRRSASGAARDENTVVFLPWHNDRFARVREAIEAAMTEGSAARVEQAAPATHDPRAVLVQLEAMFNDGLLSADEYRAKKAEVLARM